MDGQPATVTALSQSLDFATGELTSTVRFFAKDGSWSVALQILQFVSQSVPSLALQTVTVVARSSPTLNVTLLPSISTYGLPGTRFNDTTPTGIFGEGAPDVVARIGRALGVAARC